MYFAKNFVTMRECGETAAISVSFTAGVAAGAAAGLEGAPAAAAAAGALAASAGLLACLACRRHSPALHALAFFCLGLFCFLSHDLSSGVSAGGAGPAGRLAGRAVTALRRRIESIPFAHDSTSSLLLALMTGERSGLSAAQTAAFRNSGASHILALSGLHLGIIYLMISKILSIIGNSQPARKVRCATIIAVSGFYTLMTGAGPSLVRAFLFIVLNEIRRLSPEREHSPLRILLVALIIQQAFNPDVITSLGFQLSYLAMTGIFLIYPPLSGWFPADGRRFNPVRKLWDSTALTISCQILTAPLVWVRFHTFPRYFIITNLFALPLTTGIMTVSVVTVTLSALGKLPTVLVSLTDSLVQALLHILSVISAL